MQAGAHDEAWSWAMVAAGLAGAHSTKHEGRGDRGSKFPSACTFCVPITGRQVAALSSRKPSRRLYGVKIPKMNSHGASTSGGNDASSVRKDSKKPKSSAFTQQELPACKPLLTPRWVITIFMLVGVVFIPVGVAALFASRSTDGNNNEKGMDMAKGEDLEQGPQVVIEKGRSR
ncbi:hypothetical protein L7F22_027037 [Adiantum nelumboides]|nr:hypothetical protein [Adiantum nelumboides]